MVKDLLIEKSTIERKEARAKCMSNRLRLGQFVTQRVGANFQVMVIVVINDSDVHYDGNF